MDRSPRYPRWRSAAICLLASFGVVGLQASTYTVVDLEAVGQLLPSLKNGTTDQAQYINDMGQVAGFAFTGTASYTHAFLYSGMLEQDLGVLAGGTRSSTTGLNNYGQVSGNSDVTGGGTNAFLYSGGALTDIVPIGSSPSHDLSSGLNDSGAVVGYSTVTGNTVNAFLYNGTMQNLGVLNGGSNSDAVAINNGGAVAGYSAISSSVNHAFYWDGKTFSSGNPALVDIGALSSYSVGNSTSNAINANGEVAGEAYSSSTIYDAFIYNPNASPGSQFLDLGSLFPGIDSNAVAIDAAGDVLIQTGSSGYGAYYLAAGSSTPILIPTLGGATSLTQLAFNSSGEVVGTAIAGLTSAAFMWSSATGTVNLHTLSVSNSPFSSFTTAVGINTGGEIIGQGIVVVNSVNQVHSYLLAPTGFAPVPEPSTFLPAGLTILLIGAYVGRRRVLRNGRG